MNNMLGLELLLCYWIFSVLFLEAGRSFVVL